MNVVSCAPALADDISCIATPLCPVSVCLTYVNVMHVPGGFNLMQESHVFYSFFPNMRDQPLPFDWNICREHVPQARGYTHELE